MTDKELHIPRNSGERNQSAEKSFLNSRQPACTAESIRKRTCSEKFGILWKFFPKSKKQFKFSCWSGCASDLMRRADISVFVPTQLWVVLRDENNLHYPKWTSTSSAFIKDNPFKSLYQEAVCKKSLVGEHSPFSQVWKTIWGHGQGVKQMTIVQTQLHSSGEITAQINNTTAGLSQDAFGLTRILFVSVFLVLPSSLVRWSYVLLTHSLQKWISATFFHLSAPTEPGSLFFLRHKPLVHFASNWSLSGPYALAVSPWGNLSSTVCEIL